MEDFDAWADESYAYVQGVGVYVVAAVTFDPSDLGEVRSAMTELRGGHPRGKLHWVRMETAERVKAARQVADLGGFHLVAVTTGVPARKEERARARCLNALVYELHGDGRRSLCAEARQPSLDKRDVQIVGAARAQIARGARFYIEHVPGYREPLLWVADIVAGAVRSAHQGDGAYRELLADLVYEVGITYDK